MGWWKHENTDSTSGFSKAQKKTKAKQDYDQARRIKSYRAKGKASDQDGNKGKR